MKRPMRISRLVLVAALGLAVLGVIEPSPADAVGGPPSGGRVVDIEHRTVGIVRRVSSISGEIKTEEGPESVEVTLAADVLFDFDQATINPAAGQRITEVTEQLKEAKGPVAIVGHTDSKGTAAYNADLSLRRATAVRDGLAGASPSTTFTVAGKGADEPVAPNTKEDGSDDPEGRALNRRVTITFARTT